MMIMVSKESDISPVAISYLIWLSFSKHRFSTVQCPQLAHKTFPPSLLKMEPAEVFLAVLSVEVVCFIVFLAFLLPLKLGALFITFVTLASIIAGHFIF